MDPSDGECVRRLAAGQREALEPLMARHYQRLYRICLRYLRDADDALEAVQEAFVKAFRNAGQWRPEADAGAWLTRIAVNHCIDRYRQGRRRAARETPLIEGDHVGSLTSDGLSAERRVLGREIGEHIERALRTLPERQRAVFVLRHYEELSLEEIGETLGMKLGSVKSNLHRALQHLRRRLARVHA